MAISAAIVAIVCTLTVISGAKLHLHSDEPIIFNDTPSNSHPLTGKNQRVNSLPSFEHEVKVASNLPENFDPRKQWPHCPSLNEIRDQGSCASDWAIAVVSTITDRICIYSNGTKQIHVSAEDVLSCCNHTHCGHCQGGVSKYAWEYWSKFGIVSGGNYNSNQGCRPYSFPNCEHQEPNYSKSSNGKRMLCSNSVYTKTPNCYRTCIDNYGGCYKMDKQRGAFYKVKTREDVIQTELLKRGPVTAVFEVFPDFSEYKNGVYEHKINNCSERGRSHNVKLMGWGVEDGIKYWLAANSWDTYWGDNGFFKILRGVDHLGIESYIYTGEPYLANHDTQLF